MKSLVKRISIIISLVIVIALVYFFFFFSYTEHPEALDQAKSKITNQLLSLDKKLFATSKNIATHGIEGKETNKILKELYEQTDFVRVCLTISPDGTIKKKYPDTIAFKDSIIPHYQDFCTKLETKNPVFKTSYFKDYQCLGLYLGYPVLSSAGNNLGAALIIVKTSEFLDKLLDEINIFAENNIFITTSNGIFIYHKNPDYLCKHLDSYKFHNNDKKNSKLADKILKDYDGYEKIVPPIRNQNGSNQKNLHWITFNFNQGKWKIIMTEPIAKRSKYAKKICFANIDSFSSLYSCISNSQRY